MRRADLRDMLDEARDRLVAARLTLGILLAGVAILAGGWYAGSWLGTQPDTVQVVTIRRLRVVQRPGRTVTLSGKVRTLVETRTLSRRPTPSATTVHAVQAAQTLVERVPTTVMRVRTAVATRTVAAPPRTVTQTATRTRTVTDVRTVTQTVTHSDTVTQTVTVTCHEHGHDHHCH